MQQVVQRITSWLESEGRGTQVLLVPHTRDAHHKACFPQPPFNTPGGLCVVLLMLCCLIHATPWQSGSPSTGTTFSPDGKRHAGVPGLHLLPNPATFTIGGTMFGVVTADVVRHLSGAEVKFGAASADRISCLVAHLLAQHRYDPL